MPIFKKRNEVNTMDAGGSRSNGDLCDTASLHAARLASVCSD